VSVAGCVVIPLISLTSLLLQVVSSQVYPIVQCQGGNNSEVCAYHELIDPNPVCQTNGTNCTQHGNWNLKYIMTKNLANGTDLSTYNNSEWNNYKTGEYVDVSWNKTDTGRMNCNDVSVNGQKCSSCSICDFIFVAATGTSAVVIQTLKLSADCSNLASGRNAVCEDYLPVFYPKEVRLVCRGKYKVLLLLTFYF
jgi:hypothetical protein